MRTAILTVVMLVACTNMHPVALTMLTPLPADTAYACVIREASFQGYTVTDSGKTSGKIAAEKVTRHLVSPTLTNDHLDLLKVRIVETDSARAIQVVASSGKDLAGILGKMRTAMTTSDGVKKDADKVLNACRSLAMGRPGAREH